ncbi:MAG: T9SS type A sorting domain-containing protein [Flavobacteriales bacterium]|nr:T9SS type A sorting domain-containing protein [Flavobacteriales bacterium]
MKTLATLMLSFIAVTGFAQFTPMGGPIGGGTCVGLYAGDDFLLAGVNNSLYRSTDDGQTWDIIETVPDYVSPYCFASVGNVIVMGTNNGDRVYRSTDGGLNWDPSFEGMPTIAGFPSAVPSHATTLGDDIYMSGTNFIRKSTDQGQTWEMVGIDGICYGLDATENHVWAIPNGQINYTADNGATWTVTNDNPSIGFGTSVTCMAQLGDRIFAGTNMSGGEGLYYTDDMGETFVSNNSLNVIVDLYIYEGSVYATGLDGLWRSDDNGESWNLVWEGFSGGGGYGNIVEYNGVLWFATNGGPVEYDPETGDSYAPGFPFATITEIASNGSSMMALGNGQLYTNSEGANNWDNISANVDDQAMILVSYGNDAWFASAELTYELYTSTDNGASWTNLDNPFVGQVSEIYNDDILLIGGVDNYYGSIYYSTDGGNTFNASTINAEQELIQVTIDHIEKIGSNLYASTSKGYAISSDNGMTWNHTWNDFAVQIQGTADRLIGAFTLSWTGQIEYRESTDNGATWTVMMDGVPNQSIYSPVNIWTLGSNTYFQTSPFDWQFPGMFFKIGATGGWEQATEMGSIPAVVNELIQTNNGNFYAGTTQSSVWVYGEGGTINVDESFAHEIAVYPNPSSGLVNIRGNLPAGEVLTIWDLSGRAVASFTLSSTQQALDLSALPTGSYVLRIAEINYSTIVMKR